MAWHHAYAVSFLSLFNIQSVCVCVCICLYWQHCIMIDDVLLVLLVLILFFFPCSFLFTALLFTT